MNLSAKTEYACVAMLELALRHGSPEPVRIRSIAERHGIPSRFLVQILLQLKGAGLVASTRGASGGYQLARSPDSISLDEVMGVIEGPASEPGSNIDPTPVAQVLRQVWCEAAEAKRALLRGVSLADLAEQVGSRPEPMYYI
ncbi:MAG TPA: Rrf2 family transcriptional regulator [Pirellulaceae bacterium]|nr:Rrf2 family transcriptional regulator [Pirellulaceae bacterium]